MPEWTTILSEDSMLGVLEFGLDRSINSWTRAQWNRPVLDLGPGSKLVPGAIRYDYPDWDGELGELPYEGGEVGGIFAINILEHLRDPRPLIAECARVLAVGAPLTIFVPHARSGMYLQDLDHKTPFILDTWKNHLDNPYSPKGREGVSSLEIGLNIVFGLKEDNIGILTQLIKKGA